MVVFRTIHKSIKVSINDFQDFLLRTIFPHFDHIERTCNFITISCKLACHVFTVRVIVRAAPGFDVDFLSAFKAKQEQCRIQYNMVMRPSKPVLNVIYFQNIFQTVVNL